MSIKCHMVTGNKVIGIVMVMEVRGHDASGQGDLAIGMTGH